MNQIENKQGTSSQIPKKIYENKLCLIGTMHCKEKVISPPFFDLLGLTIVQGDLDTDQLGTFTGEVERKGDALACVRKKCELAMKKKNFSIGIASEGSFGAHPFIPFTTCSHEILYFIDEEKGFHLHQSLLTTKTNYAIEITNNPIKLKTFATEVGFPGHGLILKPNKPKNAPLYFKGIQNLDLLEESFFTCCKLSMDGQALIQTDMRAHMNPTRMEVILELANSFAKRLSTPCPLCENPGWGIVEVQKGLPCIACEAETDLIKFEVFGCAKCFYKEYRPRKDGLTEANPEYCNFCNP